MRRGRIIIGKSSGKKGSNVEGPGSRSGFAGSAPFQCGSVLEFYCRECGVFWRQSSGRLAADDWMTTNRKRNAKPVFISKDNFFVDRAPHVSALRFVVICDTVAELSHPLAFEGGGPLTVMAEGAALRWIKRNSLNMNARQPVDS